MEVTHILLRRPWQYDTKVVYDGFTNKISFQHHDRNIILKPLSPREVCDDQIKMREKREQEKEKSKTPKRNRKKKSDTYERKFNCLAKASEVRKVWLAREPLYLLYCKDNKVSANNSNELTISFSPSVELLL